MVGTIHIPLRYFNFKHFPEDFMLSDAQYIPFKYIKRFKLENCFAWFFVIDFFSYSRLLCKNKLIDFNWWIITILWLIWEILFLFNIESHRQNVVQKPFYELVSYYFHNEITLMCKITAECSSNFRKLIDKAISQRKKNHCNRAEITLTEQFYNIW